jgi:hypothetical protein
LGVSSDEKPSLSTSAELSCNIGGGFKVGRRGMLALVGLGTVGGVYLGSPE